MMLFEKISARVGFFFGCNQEEAIVRISPELVSIYIDASFFYAFLVNFTRTFLLQKSGTDNHQNFMRSSFYVHSCSIVYFRVSDFCIKDAIEHQTIRFVYLYMIWMIIMLFIAEKISALFCSQHHNILHHKFPYFLII